MSSTCLCQGGLRDVQSVESRGLECRSQQTGRMCPLRFATKLDQDNWSITTWEPLPFFRYTSWLKLSSPLQMRGIKSKEGIFINYSIFHLSFQCLITFQNMRLPTTKPYLKTPHTEKAMILALLGSSGELILISSVWIFRNFYLPFSFQNCTIVIQPPPPPRHDAIL